MSIVIRLFISLLIIWFVRRFHGKDWFQKLLTGLGITVAILIPQQIAENTRELQKIGNCTGSILDLRLYLLEYQKMAIDQFGNIVDPEVQNGKLSDLRIRLQNAKDSTYTICNGIGGDGQSILDSSANPWNGSPTSTREAWRRDNLVELYAWSTDALRRSTEIKPEWLCVPGTKIPIFPHNSR